MKAVDPESATRVTLRSKVSFIVRQIDVDIVLMTKHMNFGFRITSTFLQYGTDRVAVVYHGVGGVVSFDDQIVGAIAISKECPLLSPNCRK